MVNLSDTFAGKASPVISASATTTTTTTTNNANHDKAADSFLHRLETSVYNKSNMDQLRAVVNLMEKKKYNYTITVTPMLFDERKMSKRTKKMINNNKYILFNSWYTKIKHAEWPSSPAMWDLIKNNVELLDFVFLFDYIEKLGKKMANRCVSSSSASSSSSSSAPAIESFSKHNNNNNSKKKKHATIAAAAAAAAPHSLVNSAELKESCEMRDKLYADFYNVLNETFKRNQAPVTSSIYDDSLTPELLTASMEKFKSVALRLPIAAAATTSTNTYNNNNNNNNSSGYVPVAVNNSSSSSKKRKLSAYTATSTVSSNKRVKSRRSAAAAAAAATVFATPFSMVNDNTQDTNMSD
ncbi:39k [Cyclophragma undans nucleopolyhedrovirus]|uniref:39k n=1 Tax=Cyclophragma undans nucleopolyhedrovirus TaxID=1906244 RepID=A0A2U8UFF4_9ABAC|nr:39k [Cyclophragma undans nucleopolyhedrovirus]AWN01897.1 39k [Cyclophragma undans nucleopolyhedrovirus]